jgi:hypothetical protein
MKRYLFCAAIVGTFLIGVTNFALAAEGSPKEESTQTTPKEGETPAPATKAIDPKPASSEESKKEGEPTKAEKPDKKPACKPGGLLLLGVGC